MQVIDCPHLKCRAEFGTLCDMLRHRVGVEIGVDRGIFSYQLLSSSKELFLYSVDPRIPYAEMNWDRGIAETEARDRLRYFPGRSAILKTTSKQAAEGIPSPIDFVYIDGAHNYDNVMFDVRLWWSRVRLGGILAGHDFDYTPVRAAIENLFPTTTVYQVHEDTSVDKHAHPSWYVFKSSQPLPNLTVHRRGSQFTIPKGRTGVRGISVWPQVRR